MLWPTTTTMGRAWQLGGFGATSAVMDVYFAVNAAFGSFTFQDVEFLSAYVLGLLHGVGTVSF